MSSHPLLSRWLSLPVLLMFLLVGGGCAGSSSSRQRIMNGYEEETLASSRVMVLPLGSHLAISQGGRVVHVGSRSQQYFYNYFGPILDEASTAHVHRLRQTSCPTPPSRWPIEGFRLARKRR